MYVVLDFMQHDLKSVLTYGKNSFLTSEVKCLMQQLLMAVHYMHEHFIIHRYVTVWHVRVRACVCVRALAAALALTRRASRCASRAAI